MHRFRGKFHLAGWEVVGEMAMFRQVRDLLRIEMQRVLRDLATKCGRHKD
jgi:hypothetical protein